MPLANHLTSIKPLPDVFHGLFESKNCWAGTRNLNRSFPKTLLFRRGPTSYTGNTGAEPTSPQIQYLPREFHMFLLIDFPTTWSHQGFSFQVVA